jgi:hypothetical protein
LRPLAEQVIDTLLAEDPDRYAIYESIRGQRPWGQAQTGVSNEIYTSIGKFLTSWIELESLLHKFTTRQSGSRSVTPITRQLANINFLSKDMFSELDRIRRLRNSLVHGIDFPSRADLDEATKSLENILSEIRRRL